MRHALIGFGALAVLVATPAGASGPVTPPPVEHPAVIPTVQRPAPKALSRAAATEPTAHVTPQGEAAGGHLGSAPQLPETVERPKLFAASGTPAVMKIRATHIEPSHPAGFDEHPPNQPSARFAGHPATAVRTPDPTPSWLGAAPVMNSKPALEPGPDMPVWARRAIYNPTAITAKGDSGKDVMHVFFRVEEQPAVKGGWPVSRIATATTKDGVHFSPLELVLKPENGPPDASGKPRWKEDSVEDPRIQKIGDEYHMTYTAYNVEDRTARLSHAVSKDLKSWTKTGPVFKDGNLGIETNNSNKNWSKSGAMLDKPVNGKYLMWFGDDQVYMATADSPSGPWTANPKPVLPTRPTFFDGVLVEPGPAPKVLKNGNILMYYNADGNPDGYQPGWVIFSGKDPSKIVERSNTPIAGLGITQPWQETGQVNKVSFLSGETVFNGKQFFFTGGADTKTGVATAPIAADVR